MISREHHHKRKNSQKSPQLSRHHHSRQENQSKPKKAHGHSRSNSYKSQSFSPQRKQRPAYPQKHHEQRRYRKSRDYDEKEMQPIIQTEEEIQKQQKRQERFQQPIGKEANVQKSISFGQQKPIIQEQEQSVPQQAVQQTMVPRINLLAQPLTLQNFQQISPLPPVQRPYQMSRQMRGNTKQLSKDDLDNDLDDYFNFTSGKQNKNSGEVMDSQYNAFYFNPLQQQSQQSQSQMQSYLQSQLQEQRQKQLSAQPYSQFELQPLMTVKQLQEQQAKEQAKLQIKAQTQEQSQAVVQEETIKELPKEEAKEYQEKQQESYKSWVEWSDDQDDDNNTQLSLPGLPGHFKIRLPSDFCKENTQIEFKIKKQNKIPDTNKDYGSNDELNQLKNKITDYANIWERQIKFLISDFELIDIFRKDEIAIKRYNRSIINYSTGKEKLYPVFSRAYFKLWETISTNKLLLKYFNKPMQIANLAEGPGGFIHCLVDYRNQQHKHPVRGWKHDEYYSITLKIKDKAQQSLDWEYFKSKKYFQMLELQGYKVRLSYGASQDGDMLNTQNLRFFINYDLKDKKTNELKKCDLVTADGGIECSTNEDYAYQELLNVKLFFSEMITALAVQRIGGIYIMKIYDCFYTVTIEILAFLTKYYQKVWITKPYTSRPASSERYLICENFLGIENDQIEKLMDLLEQWVETENTTNYIESKMFVESFLNFEKTDNSKFKENLIKSNEDCVQSQMKKIEQGLKLIERNKNPNSSEINIPNADILEVKKVQLEKALLWCKLHKVPHFEKLELNI